MLGLGGSWLYSLFNAYVSVSWVLRLKVLPIGSDAGLGALASQGMSLAFCV